MAEPAPTPPDDAGVRALLALVVYFGAGTLAAALLQVPRLSVDSDPGVLAHGVERSSIAMVLGLSAVLLLPVALPPAVAWYRRGSVRPALLCYLLGLLVWVPVAMLAYPQLVRLAPQSHLLYFANPPESALGFAAVVLAACVLAPVVEEVVFRGYVQEAFAGLVGRPWAVVLAAALFGLVHGLAFALPIGLLGLLFGVLRERYRCLAASIAAHALHNTWNVALIVLWPDALGWVYK